MVINIQAVIKLQEEFVALRDLKEYYEWEKSRSSAWANFLKSIQPIHVIGFAIILVLSVYMITSSKINQNLIYGVIAGIVIIIILKRPQIAKEPIPENVAKKIGEILLNRKIGGELPWGTKVSSAIFCGMAYEGEWGTPFRPWKWEIGFRVVYPKGLKEIWLVCLHPFDGYITKIERKPEGYDGSITKDIKVLIPQIEVKDASKPVSPSGVAPQ